MHQVRDFIAANWSLFTSHIREKSMTDEQAEPPRVSWRVFYL
ncbi:hypothetical protein ACX97R_004394 [Escherichia coli]